MVCGSNMRSLSSHKRWVAALRRNRAVSTDRALVTRLSLPSVSVMQTTPRLMHSTCSMSRLAMKELCTRQPYAGMATYSLTAVAGGFGGVSLGWRGAGMEESSSSKISTLLRDI